MSSKLAKVAKVATKLADPPAVTHTVALLLYKGFTVIDLYGPVQAFRMSRPYQERKDNPKLNWPKYEMFTTALNKGNVMSYEGIASVADTTMDDAIKRKPEILLVPGGLGFMELRKNQPFLDKLRDLSNASRITATVCTGSGLLAFTGLLNFRPATTNKLAYDMITGLPECQKVMWQRNARWINRISGGKGFITSSGISAGIDMAIDLIKTLDGQEVAVQTARTMEYLWNSDPNNDPFANYDPANDYF